jgi:hypothetical protein
VRDEVRKVPRVLQTPHPANRPLTGLALGYTELDWSALGLIAAEAAAGIEDQTDGEQRSKPAASAAACMLEE